jgi:hypothetical protein
VSTVLAANGTTSRPGGSPHHKNGAAGGRRGDATFLRCGGCTAVVLLAQREQDYGRFVCGFLDRHEQCGNAVEISRLGPL